MTVSIEGYLISVIANKLTPAKHVQILSMLVEGSSTPFISRVADISISTVSALLVNAGKACAAHHDAAVRDVAGKRFLTDEIWSFCYVKAKNVAAAKAARTMVATCGRGSPSMPTAS